jgi:hypothetical protein
MLFAATAAEVRASDAAFLDGLRQRQLFTLAEAHCRRELARSDLSPRAKADLTVELSQTLVEHALNSPPEGRDALWGEGEKVTADFLAGHDNHPRRLVVQLADTLVSLARGESLRQEAEVTGGPAPAAAVEALRTASVKLAALRRDAATALRQRHRAATASSDELTAAQLQSLLRNIEFQSARAQIGAALAFAPGTTDRADALTQALARLDSLATSTSADEIVWQARIDRVRCRRLLGQVAAASQEAKQLAALEPPPLARLPLATERSRLAAAGGDFAAAISLLDGASTSSASPAARGDADLARLEAMLAAWRKEHQDKRESEAASRQRQASEHVRSMAARHSPYWARRAKLLLAHTLAQVPGVKDVTVLMAAAEQFWHAGRWSDALAAYDRAIDEARRTQPPVESLQLALVAASIEEARGMPSRAIQRYRQAALSAAQAPDASRAHLHAAWLAAKHHGARSDEYGRLLKEHVERWPDAASAGDARLWLGRWHESKGEMLAAATAYRAVGKDHRQFAAALSACGASYERHLHSLAADKQPTEELAEETAKYFESLLPADGADSAEKWTPERRAALIAAATIRVRFTRDRGVRAIEPIRRFLNTTSDEGDAESARALLVAALAANGDTNAAAEQLKKLSAVDRAVLSKLNADLAQISASASESKSRSIAPLRIEVLRLLRSSPPDAKAGPLADKRPSLRIAEADALATAGRRAEALAAYQALATEFPDDATVQHKYGTLLLAANDQLPTALAQWRRIEQKSRPGTPLWFEAKYSIALCHERGGEKQQAARVVTLMAALYPDLGGREQAEKFQALLARCGPPRREHP